MLLLTMSRGICSLTLYATSNTTATAEMLRLQLCSNMMSLLLRMALFQLNRRGRRASFTESTGSGSFWMKVVYDHELFDLIADVLKLI